MSPSLEIRDRGRRRKPHTIYNNTRCPKCRMYRLNPYREGHDYKGEGGLPEDPRQPFMLHCSNCGYQTFQTKLDTPKEDHNRIFTENQI